MWSCEPYLFGVFCLTSRPIPAHLRTYSTRSDISAYQHPVAASSTRRSVRCWPGTTPKVDCGVSVASKRSSAAAVPGDRSVTRPRRTVALPADHRQPRLGYRESVRSRFVLCPLNRDTPARNERRFRGPFYLESLIHTGHGEVPTRRWIDRDRSARRPVFASRSGRPRAASAASSAFAFG